MDLDVGKTDLVSREFLAVVLAGFGNGLVPLTSDYGDEPCPKSLLPVANRPLLEYVFSWLEQSGIKDVLLICPARHRSSIYHHIHSDVSSSSLRVDIQTFDESEDSPEGTCNLLRQISNRITEDFVLVPCDFVPPPSLPLSTLLNKFRVDAMAEGSLATTCWFAPKKQEKGTVVEEWGPTSGTTSIIWDPTAGTLLHIDSPDDVDRDSEDISLKMSLLNKYPHTKLSANLEDSHVYVCRRLVLDLLREKHHMDSLKDEFLPWLCKIQYRQSKRRKYAEVLNGSEPHLSQHVSLEHSSLLSKHCVVDEEGQLVLANGEDDVDVDPRITLKIGIVVHNKEDEPAVRVNTIHNFYEINKRALSITTYTLPSDPKDRALIDQRCQISTDSIIGESTQVSEKTTIKRSVIGRHCVIGKMVKINGCVLLDHCVVEDGAKLDGCILGKSTQVGRKAELARCVTQAGYEVAANETVKGEKLEVSDWTANLDSSNEVDSDSDSTD
ncbi:UDP-3-O-glucosamine N-acyltransferase [Panaeolus papilionaceus]|nr:UDP-3-O-glucosamine N-acyltransferase [Panaeolus papilionaceus]